MDTTGSTAAAVSTTDNGSPTSPGVDNADVDGRDPIKRDEDIDEAVRNVLGSALAVNTRADEDIAACAAALDVYGMERAADDVVEALD